MLSVLRSSIVGKNVGVTVGEGIRPLSHTIPDPRHVFGKNRCTSSVICSSNLAANFLLSRTVGWV